MATNPSMAIGGKIAVNWNHRVEASMTEFVYRVELKDYVK